MLSLINVILKKVFRISRRVIPKGKFRTFLSYINLKFKLRNIRINQRVALKMVQKKKKIKVAFFLIHDSVWKYEGVYRLMEKDPLFEPVVVVCPYIVYGEEVMLKEMGQAYNSFLANGYKVISTFDNATQKWFDVKKEIAPDIIFFTNPHKLTREEYYITNFLDCLTCYVPYAFVVIHLLESHYNQFFQNILWKAFYETEMHRKFAEENAFNKGRNVIITGYPGIDNLIAPDYVPLDPWKIKEKKVRRIIWAPHHSIDDDKEILSYSNFLRYHQFMLEIAKEYIGKIQIAFKPHPLLMEKLFLHEDWGKDRTEAYYIKWKNLENGQLELGDYTDLFLTSDAMIHDSASFMVEYLYTKKPVAFSMRDMNVTERFNDFGKIVFNYLYKVNHESEIKNFINTIVLEGKDNMKTERLNFLNNKLMPPHGQLASENIYKEILKELSF